MDEIFPLRSPAIAISIARSIRNDNVSIPQATLDKNKISNYTRHKEILFQK
jgi:hypothetical protein